MKICLTVRPMNFTIYALFLFSLDRKNHVTRIYNSIIKMESGDQRIKRTKRKINLRSRLNSKEERTLILMSNVTII